MVSFGKVEKKKFPLIETGEYVFTLNDVGEITGEYGDRMQWDFLVAEKETPTEYMARDDGKERVLRFFTDTEITVDSKQHQWIQAMMGRAYGVDDDLPDGSDLMGKRMVAYLTHYTPKKGKNAGIPREDIVMGSAKPFSLGGKKTNGTAKAASGAPNGGAGHAELVAEIQKQIRKATILDLEPAQEWAEINLDAMTDDELRDGLATIKDAIAAA